MSERWVWETPNDLDAIEAHVAASNYIGIVEERLFRNLIAEVRRLRALGLRAADSLEGNHDDYNAWLLRRDLES